MYSCSNEMQSQVTNTKNVIFAFGELRKLKIHINIIINSKLLSGLSNLKSCFIISDFYIRATFGNYTILFLFLNIFFQTHLFFYSKAGSVEIMRLILSYNFCCCVLQFNKYFFISTTHNQIQSKEVII